MINDQLRDCYAADGFVAIPQFVSGDDLSELIRNVDRFIAEIVPRMLPEEAFYEDKTDTATLKQLQKLNEYDPWFHELLTRGPFRELAETLLDGPVVPKDLQYFNKPPAIGKPTPPHQDGYYFMLAPCEALTMWLALEKVDEENGCVRYVAGSHHRGMREHARTTTLGFSQGIADFPTEEDREHERAVCARPGDLLVHNALTIHRADGNRSSTRSRQALGFVYFSERAMEDLEAKAAYLRRLNAEMKQQGMI